MSTPGGGSREHGDDEPVRDPTAGPPPERAAESAADPTAPATDDLAGPPAGDAPADGAASSGAPPDDRTGWHAGWQPPAPPPGGSATWAPPDPPGAWPPPPGQGPWPPPGQQGRWPPAAGQGSGKPSPWAPPDRQHPWPPPAGQGSGGPSPWAPPDRQDPWPPPAGQEPPPWVPPGAAPPGTAPPGATPPGATPPAAAPPGAWPPGSGPAGHAPPPPAAWAPPAGTAPWPAYGPGAHPGPPAAPYPGDPATAYHPPPPPYPPPPYGPPPWGPAAYGPGAGDPRPPRRRGRAITLLAVGVVLLAVLGVAIVALTRTPAAVSTADFQTIRTDVLTYAVPQDWVVGSVGGPPVLGVEFTGTAAAAPYRCDDRGFLRGVVTSALAPQQGPPAGVAATFARELGLAYYGGASDVPPEVTLSDPRTVELGGATATRIDATVRTAADDGCLATEGRLIVLAFPLGASGTALLVVNGDVAGGPAEPPSPEPAVLEAIAGTARVNGI